MWLRTARGVCFGFWCATLLAARLAGGVSTFDYFGQEQGLSHSVVRALAQDREHALWVGTRDGLFRYDGHVFRKYGTADGLPDTLVVDIHVDARGTVRVATSTGFAVQSGERFIALPMPAPVEGGRKVIDSDAAGYVYWATSDGLLRSGGTGEQRWLERGRAVRSVYVDGTAGVWFGCGALICKWSSGDIQRFGPAQGAPAVSYDAFERDREGRLWARGAGVLLAASGGGPFRRASIQPKGSGRLALDRDGRLLVPSEEGLWQDRTGGWELLSETQGLPANRVRTVLHDHEGSLWLGFADVGIARLRGQGSFESWTRNEGLPSSEVTAVYRGPDGAAWVGTRLGLVRKAAGSDRWERVGPKEMAGPIRGLAMTGTALWVVTAHEGLAVLDTRTLHYRLVPPESGLDSRKLLHAEVAPDGKLWVLTRDGVFVLTGTGQAPRFELRFQEEVGQDPAVYGLLQDRRGNYWLAGKTGLLRIGPDGTKRLTAADGLRADSLVFATLGGDGDLWVGYAGTLGVSRIRVQGAYSWITHYDMDNGTLRSNDICALWRDRRGWIWVATDNGLDVFNGERWRHLGSRDGLIWHDVVRNALFEDAEGNFWVGTNRGLSRYRPPADLFDRQPPRASISSTRFGSVAEAAAPGGPLAIAYPRRSLHVTYTASTFARAHDVRFRYRLPGLTDAWIQTSERSAMFPNLDPGRYRFEVQAGTDGVFSESTASVAFEVRAPWWRSPWFGTAVVFGAAGLCTWLLNRRAALARLREQRLEQAVRQRTAELEYAKNRTEADKRMVEQHKQEIEKLLAQSQETSRLKGEFLANVSHEIRTPMNGILGMTALALQTPLEADQREYLEAVRTSGESLLALLNDILDFSKIEAERMELEHEPFSLAECLNGALQTVKAQAHAKGLELLLETGEDLPLEVTGDALRLRQVLLNLLSNAIKFTAEGRVSLRAECEAAAEPSPGVTLLRFIVTDTGPGIPEDKLDLIFDAFRQVDGSITRKHGGTGLGLAISSRLVTLMGGRIRVESRPGQGSAFSFTARFGTAAATAASVTREDGRQLTQLAHAVQHGGTRRLRVLVAEDNVINQRLLVRLLEKMGHDSELAEGGDRALALTGQRHFDLVLMDVQMPGLDGVEATRLLRQREEATGGHTPVLMLTANAMAGDRERCLAAGADGYLAKPIDVRRLAAAIEEIAAKLPLDRPAGA